MTLVCPALLTWLFEGAGYRFPRLIPVLHAEDLAADIVDAVLLNEHAVLTPVIASIGVKLKNLLPHKAFDALTDFSGAATMLDNFRGHVYPQRGLTH
ncbi:hypothetical protein BV898_09848 [Hypsibius exemplaris]|uniref:Uncharacterized protein n=1 Tax=Hypsibius exemplaris TaxID=2072580 RepID=A0A1W0WLJ8_HYPEX|nr:hypothetical protein BV898_09848 [Hypsibius exemplaris]